jgi:4-diphosphocytidyl-2-C-methyl-D-erythritol kinase
MSDWVKVPSYAKVNLGLIVHGKRDDGYHSIESIFQTISLHDWLYFTREGEGIEVSSNNEKVPSGSSNLVYKAANMFGEWAGEELGLRIRIEKTIPIEAGLGGGSSNAAVTLMTLNRLFRYPLSEDKLVRIARKLGSDVPFFLQGGTAYVTGRGEKIEWWVDIPELYFLLVVPPFGVPTKKAYSLWDENVNKTLTNKKLNTILKLLINNEKRVIKDLKNSLEEVVIEEYPQIGYIKERLEKSNPINVLMSGSGSTVFAIFGSESEVSNAWEILHGDFLVLSSKTISREEHLNLLKVKED